MDNPNYKNWTNTKNKIDLTLAEYSILKKYFSGVTLIKEAYLYFMKTKNFYDLLYGDFSKEFNEKLYEQSSDKNKKGLTLTFLNKRIPRPDVSFEDIKPVPSGTKSSLKNWNKVHQNINNIKDNPLVLNLYSDIGEQSLMAVSLLVKKLQNLDKETKTNPPNTSESDRIKEPNQVKTVSTTKTPKNLKVISESGIDLNSKLLNFEDKDESSISKLVNKADVFIIYNYNSFINKDYRKQALETLFDYCFEQRIPIILSNKKEFKSSERKVINLKFVDEYKNEIELISDIFGK